VTENEGTVPEPPETVHGKQEHRLSEESIASVTSHVKVWVQEGRPYFPITNDAVAALLDPRLSGQQVRICLLVVLHSWGAVPELDARRLGRRNDWTEYRPLAEWARLIGVDRAQFSRQVKVLTSWKVLGEERSREGIRFRFEERTDRWEITEHACVRKSHDREEISRPSENLTPAVRKPHADREKTSRLDGQDARRTRVSASVKKEEKKKERNTYPYGDAHLSGAHPTPPGGDPPEPPRDREEEGPPGKERAESGQKTVLFEEIPLVSSDGNPGADPQTPAPSGNGPAGRRKRERPDPRVNEVWRLVDAAYREKGLLPPAWHPARDGACAKRVLRSLDAMISDGAIRGFSAVEAVRIAVGAFLSLDERARENRYPLSFLWRGWREYLDLALSWTALPEDLRGALRSFADASGVPIRTAIDRVHAAIRRGASPTLLACSLLRRRDTAYGEKALHAAIAEALTGASQKYTFNFTTQLLPPEA